MKSTSENRNRDMPPWLSSRESLQARVDEIAALHLRGDENLLALIGQSIAEAEHHQNALAQAVVKRVSSRYYRESGDFVESLKLASDSVEILSRLDDQDELVAALLAVGACQMYMNDAAASFASYARAHEIADLYGLKKRKVEALIAESVACINFDQTERAIELLFEARKEDYFFLLPIASQITTLNNIACALCQLGRFSEALEFAEIGLGMIESGGPNALYGFLLNNKATALSPTMPFSQVKEIAAKAEKIFRETGKLVCIPGPMLELGEAYKRLDRLTEARECLEHAKACSSKLKGNPLLNRICRKLAEVYEQMGHQDLALGELKIVLSEVTDSTQRDIERSVSNALLSQKFAWSQKEADLLRVVNEKLQNAKDAAEAANRAKSEFLANMSHEIRTPMNGVLGITDILLKQELPELVRQDIRTLQECGKLMVTVINDILDLSKIESGKMEIDRYDFDLPATLEEIAKLTRYEAAEKKLVFVAETASDLPARAKGDAMRIRQVVMNLLSNAVKFTEQGKITLKSEVKALGLSGMLLRVSVSDTGPGIPVERQSAIFESFTQVDGSTSRRHGGSGLGLTISKSLIELMGGRIGLVSSEGCGSTFWIELKLSHCSEATSTIVPITPLKGDLPLNGLSILLAEDNPVNQMVASRLLNRFGAKTEIAHNGQEAISMVNENPYDLVLMDCQMPIVDGFEATRRIRTETATRSHRLPIVALTANAMEGDRERCLRAGMDEYLTKPIVPDRLVETILSMVRISRAAA